MRIALVLILAAGGALAPDRGRAAWRAGDYLGVNQWVDPWDNVTMRCVDTPKVAHWIRWYTYMDWNTSRPGDFQFAPTLAGGGPTPTWAGFDFDDWFGTWKGAGMKVNLCLFKSASYCSSAGANGNEGGPFQSYPPCGGRKGIVADDYAAFAEWVYQIVARYGRGRPDPVTLRTGDRKAGLGFVDAIEIWNEPNLTESWGPWRHDTCPRTHGHWCERDVAQYTACLKAAAAASRRADPDTVVTGGVTAGFDEPYFSAVRDRGGMASMDGMNVHCYLGEEGGKGPGHAPEYRDGFRSWCRTVSAWRDEHAPGKAIWLTEFGYDAHHETARPPTFIGATLSEQANWLVRAAVLGAAELDRFFWFIGADQEPGMAERQFGNCGLVHAFSEAGDADKPAVPKKRSYWAMALMKREIGGMDYAATLAGGAGGVYVVLFAEPDSARRVAVAWCAREDRMTDSGFSIRRYRLRIPSATRHADLVELSPGEERGRRSPVRVRGGRVRLDLTECPVYVEFPSAR